MELSSLGSDCCLQLCKGPSEVFTPLLQTVFVILIDDFTAKMVAQRGSCGYLEQLLVTFSRQCYIGDH